MRRIVILAVGVTMAIVSAPSTALATHQTDPNLCHYATVNQVVWHGSSGNDTYNGDNSDDCPDGKAGNDTINGNHGSDFVLGSGGDDTIDLDVSGADRFQSANGGMGADTVTGGANQDFLYGGDGSDPLIKGYGDNDILFGGGFCDETNYYGFAPLSVDNTDPCHIDGADVIQAGDGNDFLWESNSDTKGDGQVDSLNGGAGNDDCTAESIDTVTNCETIHIIPTGP